MYSANYIGKCKLFTLCEMLYVLTAAQFHDCFIFMSRLQKQIYHFSLQLSTFKYLCLQPTSYIINSFLLVYSLVKQGNKQVLLADVLLLILICLHFASKQLPEFVFSHLLINKTKEQSNAGSERFFLNTSQAFAVMCLQDASK